MLEKHWPDVPSWKDIRTLTKESFYDRTGLRTVDVISGGFPCQPFSVAGKRRGKEDDRYLWPEMVRVIKELRPTWVVGENVAGIVRMALSDILSELEACGYRSRTFLIPACAVGARHRRYRVAIVAYAESDGQQRDRKTRQQERKKRPEERESERSNSYVSDSDGRQTLRRESRKGTSEKITGSGENIRGRKEEYAERQWRSAQSELGGMADGISGRVDGDLDFIVNHYWDAEPDIPRVAAGVKDRVGRLKALGNAVVPQQFYPIMLAIAILLRRGQNEKKTFIKARTAAGIP